MSAMLWKIKHFLGLARERRFNLVDRREFGDSRGDRRGKVRSKVFDIWGV